MSDTGNRRTGGWFLPAIVFLLSCMFLAGLLLTVKPDVFFSGDGGLKYLVVRQNAEKNTCTSLRLDTKRWVGSIWEKGFYPFKPPFVYESKGEKIVSFPPFFQMLTAPMYETVGYAGLYVIPAVSMVLLWIWFWWLLYRLCARPAVVAGAMFCLSFCSPLALYAAVYWEHTLAVLLLFGGIVFLVKPPRKALYAIILGCVTGLSAWLRPEALLLCLFIAAVVMYNQLRRANTVNACFVVSALVVLSLFFACNQVLYGSFLGAHGYQLISDASPLQKLKPLLIQFLHLNIRQWMFFPVTPAVFILVAYAMIKRRAVPKEVIQLLIIIILFSLITPFLLPNGGGKQWGPRYFLFLIPVVLVAAALFAASPTGKQFLANRWWAGLMIPVIIYSFYLNSFKAHTTLQDDYAHRVRPCMRFIERNTCTVVVVQNQFIAMEFAHLFRTKDIFLAEDPIHYATLRKLLQAAGVTELIFVAHNKDELLPCNILSSRPALQHLGDYYLTKCRLAP